MKLSGRVIERESQHGVDNLVIAVFDGGPEGVEVNVAALLRNVNRRLGSTRTEAGGLFKLDVARTAGGVVMAPRPEAMGIVLLVMAPEDALSADRPYMDAPPEKRVLYLSRVPRMSAAAEEAFLIRLTRAQLTAFDLTAGERPSSVDEEIEARHRLLERERAIDEGVARRTAPEATRRLTQHAAVRKVAKAKFEKLQRVKPGGTAAQLRIEAKQKFEEIAPKLFGETMKRIGGTTSRLPLPSDPAALERLGLKVVGDLVSGEMSVDAWMNEMLRATGGHDLVRKQTWGDVVPPPQPPPLALMTSATADAAPAEADGDPLATIKDAVLNQLGDLVGYDPGAQLDASGVKNSLKDIEQLGKDPSPADVVALHDFHVLRIAWKDVWTQLYDEDLKDTASKLYEEIVAKVGSTETTDALIGDDAKRDVELLRELEDAAATAFDIEKRTSRVVTAFAPGDPRAPPRGPDGKQEAEAISPATARSRVEKLLLKLSNLLNENYAFDVFHPDGCNFGLMQTYRQRWQPQRYQAGELVSTLPLAPGESRKYSKKSNVRKSYAETINEKTSSVSSEQASQTLRAEAEIHRKVQTATNFKLTAEGKVNLGIASISATSEFGHDQKTDSSAVNKEFQEATRRAAREYKNERSVEVQIKTEASDEVTASAELSNPNNEITVTYLFYELERVFEVVTQLRRVQPVVLVPQDVPTPSQIDEGWLVAHQWILARALLDESLRPALEYLSSGFGGDEVAITIQRANWQAQREMHARLEGQLRSTLETRDLMREALVKTSLKIELAESLDKHQSKLGMMFGFPIAAMSSGDDVDRMEAERRAAETRLKYVEEALADAQKKASDSTTALQAATNELTRATQNQWNRRVAIDQLRVHVKQNILHYMQAIWAHEPPDQRYFRLYDKVIKQPVPKQQTVTVSGKVHKGEGLLENAAIANLLKDKNLGVLPNPFTVGGANDGESEWVDPVDGGGEVEGIPPSLQPYVKLTPLVELADLDNPIGFKGNYIVFPLRQHTFITWMMLMDFVDQTFGLRDPNTAADQLPDDVEALIAALEAQPDLGADGQAALAALKTERESQGPEEIVVPSGQLFIEALPGKHPLLEEFKLRHRVEDVKKAQAESRRIELENLRLAGRLLKDDFENPAVEKKIVIGGTPTVTDPI
ncbi:MAG: hypothetical protein JNK82_13160 [Myxococcaceae bacterium]|nr:hypothetical protein [Myxococcaceae bacterium]